MLTTFNLDEYVYHAMKAGASGFLLKDATHKQLTGTIRAVFDGETLLARPSPDPDRGLCRAPAPGTPTSGAAGGLSKREREVVRLIAAGLSNAEIAATLYLSEATIRATSPASSPDSACAAACRSPSTPTSTASSAQATALRRPAGNQDCSASQAGPSASVATGDAA